MSTLAFRDTFSGGAGPLAGHVSDSGHTWANTASTGGQADPLQLDGNNSVTETASASNGGSAYVSNWTPPSSAYGFGGLIKMLTTGYDFGLVVNLTNNVATNGGGGGETWTGYVFNLSSSGNNYQLLKFNLAAGSIAFVGNTTSVPHTFTAGEEHFAYLAVAPDGSGGVNLTAYIDGVEVISGNDPSSNSPFTSGTIGFRASTPNATTTTGAHCLYAQTGPQAATLTGPTSGTPGQASGTFTLTLEVPSVMGTTATPSSGGAGGTFSPSSLSIAGATSSAPGAQAATFTWTPPSNYSGTASLTVATAGPTTMDTDSPWNYVVATATTGYTVSGASTALVGVASGAITVTPNGYVAGPDIVTIEVSGASGTLSSASLTFTATSAAQSFTFNGAAAGTATLTFRSSGGLAFTGSPWSLSIGAGVAFDSFVSGLPGGYAGSATATPFTWDGTTSGSFAAGAYAIGAIEESPHQAGAYSCRVMIAATQLPAGTTPRVAWSAGGVAVVDPQPQPPSALLDGGLSWGQAINQIIAGIAGIVSNVPSSGPGMLNFKDPAGQNVRIAMGVDGSGNRTSIAHFPPVA